MNTDKTHRYIRQTTLPEIGRSGQEKLGSAEVAIVGCGGLGSAAAVYLAASGTGRVHLIDYDRIDLSNLHRQVFYQTDQVGHSKAGTLASYLQKINPEINISFSEVALTKENIQKQLNEFPLVVDCTDSLPTKYLLNDFCVLNDKILIYGSLYKHDGYIGVFNVSSEAGKSANLRDAFPEIPENKVPNCSEIGTLNPIVGMIGIMQANEVIKLVTGTGNPLINKIIIYNAMENKQFSMNLTPGNQVEKIKQLFASENYTDERCVVQQPDLLISMEQLKEKMGDEQLKIISVIENSSLPLPFEVDCKMPLSKFDPLKLKAFSGNKIVFICQKGITSYTATVKMKNAFPDSTVYSLRDGIEHFEYS